MKQLLFMLFIGAIFYFSTLAIADEIRPQPDQQRLQQQMQRIRQAQMELDEQRQQLAMERQELERQRNQLERQRQFPAPESVRNEDDDEPLFFVLILMCLVVHILVAVWVFQDIRVRGSGSGIWIVLALIAGLLGALVYAVVRLGEAKQPEK